jgi:reactive intermediate/imine deaminase
VPDKTTRPPPPPAGPYSVFVTAGETVYLSGQGPILENGEVLDSTFEEQARLTLNNLAAAAGSAGLSLHDAVRVGVYLADMSNFGTLNRIFEEFFSNPYPARTTIQSRLPGFDIEVDAILWNPKAAQWDHFALTQVD